MLLGKCLLSYFTISIALFQPTPNDDLNLTKTLLYSIGGRATHVLVIFDGLGLLGELGGEISYVAPDNGRGGEGAELIHEPSSRSR